jgi:hypothetical protein
MRAKRLRDQLNRLSDPDYFRSPWGEEGGLTIPKNAKVNPGRRCGGRRPRVPWPAPDFIC